MAPRRRPAAARTAKKAKPAPRARQMAPPRPRKRSKVASQNPIDQLSAGEEVDIHLLPDSAWKVGGTYHFKTTRLGKEEELAGDIMTVSYDADGGWLKVHLKGSPNPELQEIAHDMWKQGQQPTLRIHRCSNKCNHQGLAPNEAHGLTVRTPGADLPWNGNPLQQDPLGFGDLAAQLLPEPTGRAQLQGGQGRVQDLLGGEEDKARKESRKRRQRRRVQEMQQSKRWDPTSSSIDPTWKPPSIRQSTSSKRKNRSSSSGGSTISSEDEAVFPEAAKVRRVHNKCPGLLLRHALTEGRRLLNMTSGENETGERIVLVFARLYRQHLQARASSTPMKREMVAICGALDAILEGNILSIANRLEIMDDEYSVLASTQETRAATTEAYDEGRIAQRLSTGYRPMVTGKGLGLRDHQEKGGKKGDHQAPWWRPQGKGLQPNRPSLVRVDQAPSCDPRAKGHSQQPPATTQKHPPPDLLQQR